MAAACFTVAVVGLSPASDADHNIVGPHWPVYRWDGVVDPTGVRAFWVFDRSGRSDVWSALNDIVDEWNNIGEVRDAGGRIPFLAAYRDGAHVGQCPDGGFALEDRYSVTFLCFDPDQSQRGLGGPLFPGDLSIHFTSSRVGGGLVRLGPTALTSGELLKTVLRHEVSHAMGMEHSGDCGALMSSPATGGCVPQAGTTWTNHDIAAFQNFYLAHSPD